MLNNLNKQKEILGVLLEEEMHEEEWESKSKGKVSEEPTKAL